MRTKRLKQMPKKTRFPSHPTCPLPRHSSDDQTAATGIPEIFVGYHWKRCCPGIVAAKTKPITTRRPTLMLKELHLRCSTFFRHVALRFCLVNRSFRTSTLKKLDASPLTFQDRKRQRMWSCIQKTQDGQGLFIS